MLIYSKTTICGLKSQPVPGPFPFLQKPQGTRLEKTPWGTGEINSGNSTHMKYHTRLGFSGERHRRANHLRYFFRSLSFFSCYMYRYSKDDAPEAFFLDTILNRHARKLLASNRLKDLGRFSAYLDFHLREWLRKERYWCTQPSKTVEIQVGKKMPT